MKKFGKNKNNSAFVPNLPIVPKSPKPKSPYSPYKRPEPTTPIPKPDLVPFPKKPDPDNIFGALEEIKNSWVEAVIKRTAEYVVDKIIKTLKDGEPKENMTESKGVRPDGDGSSRSSYTKYCYFLCDSFCKILQMNDFHWLLYKK